MNINFKLFGILALAVGRLVRSTIFLIVAFIQGDRAIGRLKSLLQQQSPRFEVKLIIYDATNDVIVQWKTN
ncbi:MAG: hypothetical protein EAZ09_11705 [Oscillatoriales cyanobacterium]|nr:MAG: hypothetical protein EAZ18_10435 [Oscillatoriales cyanobacterium]TAH21754.1 MAG: hypothetical protein EAZ09_11705 [Oscillatoriales cyanobacterium]